MEEKDLLDMGFKYQQNMFIVPTCIKDNIRLFHYRDVVHFFRTFSKDYVEIEKDNRLIFEGDIKTKKELKLIIEGVTSKDMCDILNIDNLKNV